MFPRRMCCVVIKSSNQQIKRLLSQAKPHWQKLLPQLKGGKLGRPLKMTHDCLSFRPAYLGVGVVVIPKAVVDYYCQVLHWNPLVNHVYPFCVRDVCVYCESQQYLICRSSSMGFQACLTTSNAQTVARVMVWRALAWQTPLDISSALMHTLVLIVEISMPWNSCTSTHNVLNTKVQIVCCLWL